MTRQSSFDYGRFPGFAEPAYTQVPDVILDHMMADLNEAELKVLLYIVRRTLGFKKQDDAISLDQLVHGIHRADGEALDRGTGLSRSAVRRGITGLLAKHLIVAHQNMDPYRGQLPTTYALRWAGTTPPPRPKGGYPLADRGGVHKRTGAVSTSGQGGGSPATRGPVRQRTPQETVEQQTVQQDTDISNVSNARGRAARSTTGHEDQSVELSPATYPDAPRPKKPVSKGRSQLRLDVDYQALVQPITDVGRELGDEAPARSSISRAYNLMREAGVSTDDFLHLLAEAKALTRAHQARITKTRQNAGAVPRKNLMPYLFAILQSLLHPDENPQHEHGASPARHRRGVQPPAQVPGPRLEALPTTETHPIWRTVLDELRLVMTPENYNTWLTQTRVVSQQGDLLRIAVPKPFHRDWLENKLHGRIMSTLQRLGYSGVQVEYVVAALGI
jgi:DnaA N-terminal domain/Bacteriophage replication protein O